MVPKKVLVLDLDETLIHSNHDGVLRPTIKTGLPPDFVLKVTIDRHPVRFFVHKRPHVDFFLSVVSILCFIDKTSVAEPSDLVRLRLRPKIKKNSSYFFMPSLFLTFEGFKSSIFDKNELENLKEAFAPDKTELASYN